MKIVAYYYHYYGHDSLLKLDSLNPNSILSMAQCHWGLRAF